MEKVLCVDDSGRPNEIPSTRWLKKDQVYTVEKLGKDCTGTYFFFLVELPGTAPYLGYNINRFRPVDEVPGETMEKKLVLEPELV